MIKSPLFSDTECVLKPYGFKMEEIEGFRYRCRVCLCPLIVLKLYCGLVHLKFLVWYNLPRMP